MDYRAKEKCSNDKEREMKGFTLIEMLVTMFIFALILEAAVAILISAIRLQKYNLTYFKITDQTSYVLEYMSRQIRMAQRDNPPGDCIGTNLRFKIQQIPSATVGVTGLMFKNSDGKCKGYFLDPSDKRLKEYDATRAPLILELTPSDIEISSLGFDVRGESATDAIQPRVTILMKVRGKNQGSQPAINIQTTVSARNLDF